VFLGEAGAVGIDRGQKSALPVPVHIVGRDGEDAIRDRERVHRAIDAGEGGLPVGAAIPELVRPGCAVAVMRDREAVELVVEGELVARKIERHRKVLPYVVVRALQRGTPCKAGRVFVRLWLIKSETARRTLNESVRFSLISRSSAVFCNSELL